jgi:uncharacterized lipoprotein
MTLIRVFGTILLLLLVGNLVACSKDKEDLRVSCDEPQPYQAVVEHERIVSPEGLDQLDKLKEMQIPTVKISTPPTGSKCIEYPPSVF